MKNSELLNNSIMGKCSICPRNCGVDRAAGQIGFCKSTATVRVARAALHMWEEPCISGEAGSGAVFFSGCNLRCVFCQNQDIASGLAGKDISIERLSQIFMELQDKGANNINLVTPSHYVPQIADALDIVRDTLNIPVVYNSSAYENVDTLRLMEEHVSIYLPDFKYYSDELAKRYSNAADYRQIAISAIDEMLRQAGEPEFDADGIMKRGVIIRHLVLPGATEDSKKLIKLLYDRYGNSVYYSIMSQFTPLGHLIENDEYKELHRKLSRREYDEVVDYAIDLGIENGFIQEEDVADESFIPAFDGEGV